MIKKLIFASFLALILSGCLPNKSTVTISPGQPNTANKEAANKLSQIIQSGGNAKCQIATIEKPNSVTEMLISGKKIKLSSTDTQDGKKGYILVDGQYTYIWAEGDTEGFKTKNETPQDNKTTPVEEPDMYTSEDYATVYEDETKYKISCEIGTAKDQDFQAPSNVKFTDPSDLIKK